MLDIAPLIDINLVAKWDTMIRNSILIYFLLQDTFHIFLVYSMAVV
jgi:hypothetical protein